MTFDKASINLLNMLRKLFFITLFFIATNSVVFSQEGKLASGKESLKSSKKSNENDQNDNDDSDSSDESDAVFADFFRQVFVEIGLYISYGVLVEFPDEYNGKMYDAEIAKYPYQEPFHGNFIYTDDTNYNTVRFDISNSFVIEDGGLKGNHLSVNIRFLQRFGLGVEYLNLKEKINTKTDSFSLTSALLKYYRIRSQRFDFWYGLGIMHVGNDVNSSGFGLGLGGELFVAKPISLALSHKWAKIGFGRVRKTEIVLKSYFKNYHVFSGYEQFKIGVSEVDTFSIGVGASF